jgi:FAD synthetase
MVTKRRVLAFGTFDGLHPGHLFYLKQAKKSGTELIVVIARDKTVEKIKGKKPILKEKERKHLIESLKPVDKVVLGTKKGKIYKIVEKLKPEVIALGYDQKPAKKELEKELKKIGMQVKIKRMKAFNPKKFKSSKLKKEIIKQFGN